MGIPSFFKQTIQDYPEIICPISSIHKTIDYLCLDLNCAIHPCCAHKENEQDMYHSIFEKIQECITLTKVSKCVYIAIDGPAPRTKMEQQRQRRLKSSQEEKQWDTNAITPGTLFMEKLNIYLDQKCKTLSINYILSDSNEPGEGEHKIMKFIDTLPVSQTISVYGLDADLIMLSLIRQHNVFLLRERTIYNFEDINEDYLYLNISLLKKYVIETLQKPYIRISNKSLLQDYIFLCFFIGNDFIMNTPAVNIRYNGIQTLLQTYLSLQQTYEGLFYLLDDKQDIHLPHFKLLIRSLAIREEVLLQDILEIRKKQYRRFTSMNKKCINYYKDKTIQEIIDDKPNLQKIRVSLDEYETYVNNIPIQNISFEEKIIQEKKYNLYHLFHTEYSDPSIQEIIPSMIDNVCRDYLRSIYWTTHYYFNECLSWKWYYPHHFSPLLSDLHITLEKITTLDKLSNKLSDKTPYLPAEQLSIVLPKKSHNLLQDKRYLLQDYMYPTKTPLTIFMKRYLWECHPLLPH